MKLQCVYENKKYYTKPKTNFTFSITCNKKYCKKMKRIKHDENYLWIIEEMRKGEGCLVEVIIVFYCIPYTYFTRYWQWTWMFLSIPLHFISLTAFIKYKIIHSINLKVNIDNFFKLIANLLQLNLLNYYNLFRPHLVNLKCKLKVNFVNNK